MSIPDIQSIKEAQTETEIHPLIKKRWSARAFSDKAIDENALKQLFEAASWAPSSMNEQPWRYYYAHKHDTAFERYHDCLLGGNKLWADKAQVLVLSLAKKYFSNNANPNRHALHDVGAANILLLLQAAELDIYGHQLGGFDREKTIQTFQLPDDLEPVCFIALGYLGDVHLLEEPFKSREQTPRARKPLAEIVSRYSI
ncbi:MAG: nitroreductase family protein [Flavobacteriales bacterium]